MTILGHVIGPLTAEMSLPRDAFGCCHQDCGNAALRKEAATNGKSALTRDRSREVCKFLSAGPDLVQVGFQLHVLKPLLQKGYHGSGRHVITTDVAFVDKTLISKHKGRV